MRVCVVSAVRSLYAVGVSGHILIHIEYVCAVSIKQRWVVYHWGLRRCCWWYDVRCLFFVKLTRRCELRPRHERLLPPDRLLRSGRPKERIRSRTPALRFHGFSSFPATRLYLLPLQRQAQALLLGRVMSSDNKTITALLIPFLRCLCD